MRTTAPLTLIAAAVAVVVASIGPQTGRAAAEEEVEGRASVRSDTSRDRAQSVSSAGAEQSQPLAGQDAPDATEGGAVSDAGQESQMEAPSHRNWTRLGESMPDEIEDRAMRVQRERQEALSAASSPGLFGRLVTKVRWWLDRQAVPSDFTFPGVFALPQSERDELCEGIPEELLDGFIGATSLEQARLIREQLLERAKWREYAPAISGGDIVIAAMFAALITYCNRRRIMAAIKKAPGDAEPITPYELAPVEGSRDG